jgi:hypothetical protein
MARPLLPELIKAIRATSRGVSRIFPRENTHGNQADTRTPHSPSTEKVVTYLPRAQIYRPTFVEQSAPYSPVPGVVVVGDHFGGRSGFGDYIAKPVDRPRLIHFNPISVHDVFPRSLGSGMFAFDWVAPSIHSHRALVRFTSAPLMPVLENDEQPGGSEDNTHPPDRVGYCPGRRSAWCSPMRPWEVMVQPQIGLSAGGPSTLGSFHVKMRFGQGLFMPSNIWSSSEPNGATLRKNGSSTPRSRSRFRERLFRVTTLATLISDPDR